MSIDKDKIRKKLEALKNPKASGTGGNNSIWKAPKLGEPAASIRLLQYPFTGGEEPFIELYFHYSGLNVLCPKYNGKGNCPVCEAVKKLRSTKNAEDDALAKELYAKPRYFALMIDRSDPTLTPKYWGFSKTIYTKLLEKLIDEEYQAFLDPVNGIDLTVKTDQQAGKKYAEADFSFKRKESKLAETDKDVQKIMKAVVPVEEVFKSLTEQEIKAKLDEWIASSEKKSETEAEPEGRKEVVKGKGSDVDVEAEFKKSFEEAMNSLDD